MATAWSRTSPSGSDEIRYWERLLIALLGWMLVGVAGTDTWQIAVQLVGWMIIAAAMGVVELAMALYYRLRRTV